MKTPVVAVSEDNYQQNGIVIVPAGSRAVGRLANADKSGYIEVHFDSLDLPFGPCVQLKAVATDLHIRPLRGRGEGKGIGRNLLVRSAAGIGQVAATLVGRGNLNQPLSEEDMVSRAPEQQHRPGRRSGACRNRALTAFRGELERRCGDLSRGRKHRQREDRASGLARWCCGPAQSRLAATAASTAAQAERVRCRAIASTPLPLWRDIGAWILDFRTFVTGQKPKPVAVTCSHARVGEQRMSFELVPQWSGSPESFDASSEFFLLYLSLGSLAALPWARRGGW